MAPLQQNCNVCKYTIYLRGKYVSLRVSWSVLPPSGSDLKTSAHCSDRPKSWGDKQEEWLKGSARVSDLYQKDHGDGDLDGIGPWFGWNCLKSGSKCSTNQLTDTKDLQVPRNFIVAFCQETPVPKSFGTAWHGYFCSRFCHWNNPMAANRKHSDESAWFAKRPSGDGIFCWLLKFDPNNLATRQIHSVR